MKIAYRINELVALGPLKRTKIYSEIKAGRLTARKIGGATIILADDWNRFVRGERATRDVA